MKAMDNVAQIQKTCETGVYTKAQTTFKTFKTLKVHNHFTGLIDALKEMPEVYNVTSNEYARVAREIWAEKKVTGKVSSHF